MAAFDVTFPRFSRGHLDIVMLHTEPGEYFRRLNQFIQLAHRELAE